MFGIGLPEMLLIMALALIVVGPDKLPDLARSLAKGLMDLKKAASELKQTLDKEGNPLAEIRPELEEAAKSLKTGLLEVPDPLREAESVGVNQPASQAAEAYQELLRTTAVTNPEATADTATASPEEEAAMPPAQPASDEAYPIEGQEESGAADGDGKPR
jgi:sec-independent protein translocase protein TatB